MPVMHRGSRRAKVLFSLDIDADWPGVSETQGFLICMEPENIDLLATTLLQ
jgi:hypothetical protein